MNAFIASICAALLIAFGAYLTLNDLPSSSEDVYSGGNVRLDN